MKLHCSSPQLGFTALGDLQGIVAHGLDVERDIEGQKIREGLDRHAVGDQRGPLGLHKKEFGGDRRRQQSRQRAERGRLAALAAAMDRAVGWPACRCQTGCGTSDYGSLSPCAACRSLDRSRWPRETHRSGVAAGVAGWMLSSCLASLRVKPRCSMRVVVLFQGDDVSDGGFLTIIITYDELQFYAHGGPLRVRVVHKWWRPFYRSSAIIPSISMLSLIQMPFVAWARPPAPQLVRILLPKLATPLADGFGGDGDTPCEQEFLHSHGNSRKSDRRATQHG